MSKLITTISYIIPPDTPGYIRVTAHQLEYLMKAKLLKQIGTRCVGPDCEPLHALPDPDLDSRKIFSVREAGRKNAMYRCYLI